jgi:hypothetical protein
VFADYRRRADNGAARASQQGPNFCVYEVDEVGVELKGEVKRSQFARVFDGDFHAEVGGAWADHLAGRLNLYHRQLGLPERHTLCRAQG